MATFHFLIGPILATFLFILSFSKTNFTEKIVGVIKIRTRIAKVEGEHLTTTTVQTIEILLSTSCEHSSFVVIN